ncbi:MAG: hypothetical protein BGO09_04745 [Bacteroidetes bacterium 47-18]|nr:MAG: hypothetical protein BGO09_04745 [Bacteroidetes bacterium 47-18]
MIIFATIAIIIHLSLIYFSFSEMDNFVLTKQQKSVLRFIAPIIPYIVLFYNILFKRNRIYK